MKLNNLPIRPRIPPRAPTPETEIAGGDGFFRGIVFALLIEFGVVGVLIFTVYLVSLAVRWLAAVR